ncbi:murein L,D-transpeptidase catalytic domain-containing protein [Flavobacterium sp. KACC 22761]|uniref:murein L,D-transpeptidase catalytic domain-containing protein n=1 Tax=Flavobacterium sp. KACC 22761 TaxID=3092665 RepID=UPI002A75C378|nr:murein L,D-transpeptidase catalytic domain family protein [Flavobacterium sp. KACC 22761]WPO78912.1 murein L,D-transpeptidase catalytic domain family protein [Flavobacterium sp. KACC 22761]
MKIFNLIIFLSLSVFGNPNVISGKENWTETDVERFNNQLAEVKEKIKSSPSYNTKIAFFIDMKIKSGKNRFFVYDLENDKIIDEGLVAHGCGSETGVAGSLKFSNEPNSNATSLGRYAIGKSYKGMFGKSYKLNGLDQSNSNALKRAVVLHSYSAVPEEEQDYYISRSHGCPMVSEVFFKRLEKIIDNSKSAIILNIYY